MKKIKQFRYCGDGNSNNYPVGLTKETLTSRNNIFEGYTSISQLGIQARPGVKIYLNNSNNYPIVIGETGIFEINFPEKTGIITNIRFDANSFYGYLQLGEDASNIYKSDNPLLIDIIYEGSGESV